MKKKFSLFVVAMVLLISSGFAQKIKVVSGSISKLKNQKTLSLEYVYNDVIVGKKMENVYIEEKVADYNSDEPGKGDNWKKAWFDDREARFQPKFEELLNKYLEEIGLTANPNDSDAPYLMILKTKMIEPGFNVGVVRRPAGIEVEISIVENNQGRNSVAEISMTKIPGSDAMGFDFDTGQRISEAYAKCGKALAKYIVKNVK